MPDGLPPIRQDASKTVASEESLEGRRPTLQLNVEGERPGRTIQANGGEGVGGRIERAFGGAMRPSYFSARRPGEGELGTTHISGFTTDGNVRKYQRIARGE